MIPLDQDIETTTQLIQLFESGDDTKTYIEEVTAILDSIEPLADKLDGAIRVRRRLDDSEVDFEFNDTLVGIRNIIAKFVEQETGIAKSWKEASYKIRQNGVVQDFSVAANGLCSQLVALNKLAWDEWVDELKAKFSVIEAQIESVANVPEYAGLVIDYKNKNSRFIELSDGVPEDPDGVGEFIAKILSLADSLVTLRTEIRFDLPAEILDFFNALDRDGTFPLEKYGVEIMEWLRENNGLKGLVVSKKGFRRL